MNRFFSKSRKGQGLVEYIILVGLIAIFVFAIIKTFGSDLQNQFQQADTTIKGTIQ